MKIPRNRFIHEEKILVQHAYFVTISSYTLKSISPFTSTKVTYRFLHLTYFLKTIRNNLFCKTKHTLSICFIILYKKYDFNFNDRVVLRPKVDNFLHNEIHNLQKMFIVDNEIRKIKPFCKEVVLYYWIQIFLYLKLQSSNRQVIISLL